MLDFEKKITQIDAKIYSSLTPWQKVQIARYEERPHALSYIESIMSKFIPLAGDRSFGEDKSVVSGIGKIDDHKVMVLGIEKGHDIDSRLKHNYGMVKPEGYRKIVRLVKLADKFNLPIISLIDTPGAFPGAEAEERGQGEAIAQSIATYLNATVPIISIVIGEGGSGGAMALAAGNIVAMLEHSIYTVITPEGCASILWRDATKAQEAAQCLGITAQYLHKEKIIDAVIKEPLGGAHSNKEEMYNNLKTFILESLVKLKARTRDEILLQKQEKFLRFGTKIS